MTAIDEPPYHPGYDEPDEPPAPRPRPAAARPLRGAPPHDLDAERAALGSMLQSLDACDTIIETGLAAADFYAPFHAAVYTAICDQIATGQPPDIITTSGHLLDQWPNARTDVFTLQAANDFMWTAAGRYAARIATCAHSRRLQGAALAVAEAAATNDLDSALRRVAELTDTLPDNDPHTTWAPIDLAAILEGDGPPPPTMLRRDDGQALLYPGKVHGFNAEPESGKSWLAQWACVEQLEAGEHVVYLDFEDNPADVAARLRHLGATTEQITSHFHYIRPDDPIDTTAIATLERLLTQHRPSLAIIDGVTEVMVQNGWSITDNDDAARFLLALPRRIARHGTAVVLIDHVPKDREGRGRYGIGAQHKLAGIDGATYTLEVTRPFGRGRSGTARITVNKDRPGHIRGIAVDGRFAGELRVNSLPDGLVHIQIAAHSDNPIEISVRPTTLMERVSTCIEDLNEAGVEPNRNAVIADVPGKRTFVIEALKRLVTEGYVEVTPGPNRAILHRSTRPYRSATDPRSEAYEPTEEPPSDLPLEDL